MRVARNIAFERLKKLETGKLTHRICEIMKRHKVATELSPTLITDLQGNEWMVNSTTEKKKQYKIIKNEDECTCRIICRICKICPHTYTCECMDALLHATICKHIHLIHITNTTSSTKATMITPQSSIATKNH